MIVLVVQFILKFIQGGLAAIRGTGQHSIEKKVSEVVSENFSNSFESLMSPIEDGSIEFPDIDRVISPFESHMEMFFSPESVKTNTGVIESLGSSLDSLGEEIMHLIPDSKITSKVGREKDRGQEVIFGHLDLKIDKYSPLVYSIYMDLLKDGFVYRTDSKSFVITAEVAK